MVLSFTPRFQFLYANYVYNTYSITFSVQRGKNARMRTTGTYKEEKYTRLLKSLSLSLSIDLFDAYLKFICNLTINI